MEKIYPPMRNNNKFQISNFRFQIGKKFLSACSYLWLIALLCAIAPLRETSAQVRPVYDYGAIGLGQLLKKLSNTKSVMHIGAHPDDEDSGLLAFLARGENARTAYLSLTRGEGGQNIIGRELSEALGVIRTEELLQARRLDGAEQYFTRAIDYGFSKTLAEAKEKWDEKIVLCDAVRAIRSFRPLVVISRFSGTPADGHGQHQYAGYIAPLAVKAAGDANQCTEAGAPWQVLKFYVGQGFRSTAEPTLRVNTGKYDFLLGRSYFEIAMEGRSQHKTQEQGVLELKGERFSGLNLIESKAAKVEKETSVFDGIDTSLTAIPKHANLPEGYAGEELAKAQNYLEKALQAYDTADPQKIFADLAYAHQSLSEAQKKFMINAGYEKTGRDYRKAFLLASKKRNEIAEAIGRAKGISVDVLADRETVVPEEEFSVTVKIFYPQNAEIENVELVAPEGWIVTKTTEPQDANQNPFRRENANRAESFRVKVPKNAKLTQPYWLENLRNDYLFRWESNENQTLSFGSPTVFAKVTMAGFGDKIIFQQPVEFRFADDIRGEIRRNLNVVPALSVSLDQNLIIVPQSTKEQTRKISLSVVNNISEKRTGTADLKLPAGWQVRQKFGTFQTNKRGENTSFTYEVVIPANSKPGTYNLEAVAEIGGEKYDQTTNTIAYPHIQTHRYYTPAKTKVEVIDLKTAPVKIGYIAGSGDRVADAIRQMNFDLQNISENDLTNADLSRFDAIVVGIRASQVRPDFIANHQRLLDYVKNGGTLIVQYQLPVYQSLLPFPAQMGARVTDENAKMTILEPAHSVFNFPNKITDEDFKGWVQERNLYAFSTFDPNYKPLLESHDAGEAENKGGLVVAGIGKGKFVYCSYAFFRQLPAGVPGAYRLFANILSLPKTK